MQYAQLKFGWTSIQLGNFISLMGSTRIVALCVAIPLLIKIIRKPHKEPERDPHPTATISPPSGYGTRGDENGESSSSTANLENRQDRTTNANANASTFSKVEDDEWDAHTKQHRLIHDYSE